jgi:hypothetical protein
MPVLQISTVRRTLDYLVNRATLRYNIPLGGGDNRQASTFVMNNTNSQFTTKQIAPVTIDAIGRYEDLGSLGVAGFVADWVESVAAVALAYFGSHLCTFTVTFGWAHVLELYPGRQALVTDDRILHPRTGERGVTDLPCWCVASAWDPETGIGEATMIFHPRNVTA